MLALIPELEEIEACLSIAFIFGAIRSISAFTLAIEASKSALVSADPS